MQTFTVTIAHDVSCYSTHEIEAETVEGAIEIVRNDLEGAMIFWPDCEPCWETMTNCRVVMADTDGGREVHAEDVPLDSHLDDVVRYDPRVQRAAAMLMALASGRRVHPEQLVKLALDLAPNTPQWEAA